MKVVKQTGVRKVEVVDVADPEATPGRVVVDMRAAGICGSDLHNFRRERPQVDIPPGHEPCGVVSSVGHGVGNVKEGDRVTLYHYEGCGHCQECRRGDWMWCGNREDRIMGHNRQGSCAEKILVDERNCLKLPDELSFIDGAFIACGAGTVWSSMRKVTPTVEDRAVVFGLGPIGLLGVLFMKTFGADVIAVGRRASRLKLAEEFGARVIDIDSDENADQTIKDTWPKGATLGFETSGAVVAQQQLISCLGRYGRAVTVGLGSKEPSINFAQVYGRQLTIYGSFVMNVGEYGNLAAFLVRNELDLSRLVSHRLSIDQAQEAFDAADAGDCTKVMFVW